MDEWRIVPREDLNDDLWDHCVAKHGMGLPFSQTSFMDGLGGEKWCGLVYGSYKGVMVLPMDTAMGIVNRSRTPLGAQQLGMIGELTADERIEGIKNIPRYLCGVDLTLNCMDALHLHPADWKKSGLGLEKFSSAPNFVLDLSPSYQEVYSRYKQRVKRHLKASQSLGLHVFEYDTPDVLVGHFRVEGQKKYGDAVSKKFLQRMTQSMFGLIHRRQGMTWSVYGEGNQFHAGVFVVPFQDRLVLYFSAVSEAGKKSQAMTFLLNELFIYASAQWKCFDFEGTRDPGLSQFIQGFGAVNQPYLRYQRWNIPGL